MMFVVGATRSEDITRIRKAAPTHFFLVPGVGAQGGSLQDVVQYGWNTDCGLLVNSSRGIIYASQEENFAELAALEAEKLQQEMAQILEEKGW
jgi:orotidine-5'-phosphate decarboxylase